MYVGYSKINKFFFLVILLKTYVLAVPLKENDGYLDKKFNEITWLTAHNSHLNWVDNSVIELASNQILGIEKQLASGVRGFMFDIDFVKCTGVQRMFELCSCEGVCLCHGSCSKQIDRIKDGLSVKKLEYALKKIVKFLNNNTDQIITIFFEDYIADTKLLQDVFARVKNFNKLVFDPYSPDWDVLNKGWPRIRDMVNANKRLLIFDDEQRGMHAGKKPGFIRSRDYLLENHYEWVNDFINVSVSDFAKLKKMYNTSYVKMEISRCYSLHKSFRKPNWDSNTTLDLNFRENDNQLINSQKLFLLHHYYGVFAKKSLIDPRTVELMNSKELILERLNKQCNPGINGKKPNYIALDFIKESTYEKVIVPFNSL